MCIQYTKALAVSRKNMPLRPIGFRGILVKTVF